MKSRVRIAGLGTALPARVVASSQIEQELGLPDGWCERTTGVRERRRAISETTLSMAADAANAAIQAAGNVPSIDLIIGASSAPQQAIPCTAALLQRALGLENGRSFCLDVNATCLSFLVAVDLAAKWISSGASQSALIFSSETTRQSLNPAESESFSLIGDGAAAAVLVASGSSESELVQAQWATHSSCADLTQFLGAGTLHHPNDPATTAEMNLFSMQGRSIFRVAARELPPFLDIFFISSGWQRSDVDVVIPHQASRIGLELLTARCGFREEQVFSNLATRGNCVAASIPLALSEAVAAGCVQRGDRVLLLGTGAGFSMGALALTY